MLLQLPLFFHFFWFLFIILFFKLNKINFSNNKEKIVFVEDVVVDAVNYAAVSGAKMIFTLNAYNQFTGSVKRIRNRKNPFQYRYIFGLRKSF